MVILITHGLVDKLSCLYVDVHLNANVWCRKHYLDQYIRFWYISYMLNAYSMRGYRKFCRRGSNSDNFFLRWGKRIQKALKADPLSPLWIHACQSSTYNPCVFSGLSVYNHLTLNNVIRTTLPCASSFGAVRPRVHDQKMPQP